MSKILAIDPGSNKCGLAHFENDLLITTETIESKEDTPLHRRLDIAWKIEEAIKTADIVICEEPFLQGRNNNGMQRLLGYIEFLAYENQIAVHFIHPMSVKKAMGTGKLDKEEVKHAIVKFLNDTECLINGEVLLSNRYDETDAIAIGLTYLIEKGERHATQKGKRKESKKRKHRRTCKKRLSHETSRSNFL